MNRTDVPPSVQSYVKRHGKAASSGMLCERMIISYKGWTPSSKQDNIELDIDARDGYGLSYSLKTGIANERSNRLAFELDYEDAQGNVFPSWYATGKADFYVFGYHNQLLYIHRARLHEYIEANGWDCVLRPSKEVLDANQQNHIAKTCRNGIISIHRLYNGLVTHTEVLNYDDRRIKEYHRTRYDGTLPGNELRFLRSGKRYPTGTASLLRMRLLSIGTSAA